MMMTVTYGEPWIHLRRVYFEFLISSQNNGIILNISIDNGTNNDSHRIFFDYNYVTIIIKIKN